MPNWQLLCCLESKQKVGWSRWQFLSSKSKTPVWKRLRKSWSARESLHSRKGEIVHSVGAWILEISGCGGVFGMATFAGTTQKCKACEKTVYLVDQLTADNKVYHKACFRCHHCKGTLKVTTQKENKQTLSNRGMPGHTFWHWSSCFAVLFGFFYRLYMDHFFFVYPFWHLIVDLFIWVSFNDRHHETIVWNTSLWSLCLLWMLVMSPQQRLFFTKILTSSMILLLSNWLSVCCI